MTEDEENENKKYVFKLYLNEEENEILEKLKPLFSTKANVIRCSLYYALQKHFDSVTKDFKRLEKRILKRKMIYKTEMNSPDMINHKMDFRDQQTIGRVIQHSYKILKIFGKRAKRPLLRNIRRMRRTITSNECKKVVLEYEFKIKNHFDLVYENFLETIQQNINYKRQNKMSADFSEIESVSPRIDNKKIKKRNQKE